MNVTHPIIGRRLACMWALIVLVACTGDRTITRGAKRELDWQRRLASALPVGTSQESARRSLEKNGFRCPLAQARDTLWCDKWSGGRLTVVRRRWQAVLRLDGGRVADVRGTTGLVGP